MEDNVQDKKTDLEIIFEQHPELECKILAYVNSKDFETLYIQYFKTALTNCIDACSRHMDKKYVRDATKSLLKEVGANGFRNYAELIVVRNIIEVSRKRCIEKNCDFYEFLDKLFTNSVCTDDFKEWVILILKENAKYIGKGYLNMLLNYLDVDLQESTQDCDYDYSEDDLEPS